MIFDAKEFEHFVDEQSLKKGYRLFEKGLPELEKSSAPEYRFHIGEAEIVIRRRGDKILSYRCSCGKQRSCEHLGAAMFYLQRHSLNLARPSLKRTPPAEKPRQVPAHQSVAQRQKSIYDACSSAICELLRPYLAAGKLDATQIADIHGKLSAYLSSTLHDHEREFHLCINLAVYAEVAPLFGVRFTADETVLRTWYASLSSRIGIIFQKGLNTPGREAWLMATLRSLRSDKCLDSGAYSFLLPRYLCSHPSRDGMELLCELIGKRKQRTGYLRRISHLLTAAIQLYIRMNGAAALPLPFRYRKFAAECALAQAELDLCAGRPDKGLDRLEDAISHVRDHQPDAIQEYMSLVINAASLYHRKDMEIRLRRDCILRAMFIRQEDLDQLLKLYPLHKKQSVIESLLADMKHPPAVNTFDKIAALLMANNRVDELVREMKTEDGNLALMNEVALKNVKTCDGDFVALYASKLARALNAAPSIQHQTRIFGNARDFLQKLPSHLSDKAAELLLTETGEHTRIGAHIRSFFRFTRIHLN